METAKSICWNEPAVVSIDAKGDRSIAFEGTLEQAADFLAHQPEGNWHRYLLALPERCSPPFRYETKSFQLLIAQLRAMRAAARRLDTVSH